MIKLFCVTNCNNLLHLKLMVCNNSVTVQSLHTIKKKFAIYFALFLQTHVQKLLKFE